MLGPTCRGLEADEADISMGVHIGGQTSANQLILSRNTSPLKRWAISKVNFIASNHHFSGIIVSLPEGISFETMNVLTCFN